MSPSLIFLFGAVSGIVVSKTFRPLLRGTMTLGMKLRRNFGEMKEGLQEDLEDLSSEANYESERSRARRSAKFLRTTPSRHTPCSQKK